MSTKRGAQRKGERGFTLIELIVVVGIILILAALIAPNVVDIEDLARKNAVIADAKSLRTAMDLYFLESSSPKTYPPDGDITSYDTLRNTLSPYVTLPPENDANFTFSDYVGPGNRKKFKLVIVGKDSAPTTVTITEKSISY